jgi:tRNA A-37 threonylcarbamoyl transferase component Bud32
MSPPSSDRHPGTPPEEEATLPPRPPDRTDGGAEPATLAAGKPPAATVPLELVNHPRYRVLKLLGQGGMGAVYLAEQLVMGRRVALKTINTRFLNSPDAVGRFHREVRAAAKLAHPNVVAAYDAEQAADLHFLIMEYVDGLSVAEHARRHSPLSVKQACAICAQAALGLQHAHERGLVHRDIKPHNLMLTPKGQVKILDFGLAHFSRQEDTQGDSALTATGAILGTADYIAPEQTSSSRTVDIRADIYSLGCTLYFLLTGRVPFPGGTLIDKCVHHALDAPPPLSSLRPGLPAGLAAVVERMMAKRPEDRFPTPAEVFGALRPFAGAGHGPLPQPAVAVPAGDGARPDPTEATSESLTAAIRAATAAKVSPRDDKWWTKVALVVAAVALSVAVPAALLLAFVLNSSGDGKRDKGHPAAGSPPSPRGATHAAGAAPAPVKMVAWEGEGRKRTIADPAHALNDVLDFREIVGAARNEFLDWQKSLGPDFRLAVVNARKGSGPALFNAVAVREKKPRLERFFPDMTDAEESRTYKRMASEQGFHFLGECLYAELGRVFHSEFWLQDEQKWYAWVGPLTFVTNKVAEEKKSGWRPFFFEAVRTGDRGLYRALGAPDQGLQWEPYYTLGPEELLSAAKFGKLRGQRPDALTAYWDGERFRFILVLLENRDHIDWRLRTDMTLAEYKKESSEQKRQGLLPLALTSYGDEVNVRYAAVWVRYRLPE